MTSILNVLVLIFQLLSVIILIRSFLSWLAPGQSNLFTRVIYQFSEPILRPIRRIVPIWRGLDFSPFIAIVILQVIVQLISYF